MTVTVAGQALSSMANLVMQLGLVLSFEPDRFGRLVVALAVYYFALAIARAVVGDPMVAAVSVAPRCPSAEEWQRHRRRLLAIGSGAAATLLLLAAIAAVGGWGREPLVIALAVSMPALMVHDGYRYRSWAQARPENVVVMDGIWLAAVIAGALVAVFRPFDVMGDLSSGELVLLGWLLGGWLSVAVGHHRSRIPQAATAGLIHGPPEPATADRPADGNRSLSASQVLLAIDSQGLPAAIAVVGGATAGGVMRAGVLPFIPLITVLGALRILALPRLRRAVDSRSVALVVVQLASGFAAVAVVMAAVILMGLEFVPDAWLGPTGRTVRPWFVAGALIASGRMVGLVPSDAVALGGSPGAAVRYRLATSALDWTVALSALALFGVGTALWARAVVAWIGVGLWLVAVRVHGSPQRAPSTGQIDVRPASPLRPNALAVTDPT